MPRLIIFACCWTAQKFARSVQTSCCEARDMHHLTCGVCADDFEQFPDDEMMTHCALTCRPCAQSCREMASGGSASLRR